MYQTCPIPKHTLAATARPIWVLAAIGISNVEMEQSNAPAPKTHFPPNFSESNAPIIWVKIFPYKCDPSSMPCSAESQSNSPNVSIEI